MNDIKMSKNQSTAKIRRVFWVGFALTFYLLILVEIIAIFVLCNVIIMDESKMYPFPMHAC